MMTCEFSNFSNCCIFAKDAEFAPYYCCTVRVSVPLKHLTQWPSFFFFSHTGQRGPAPGTGAAGRHREACPHPGFDGSGGHHDRVMPSCPGHLFLPTAACQVGCAGFGAVEIGGRRETESIRNSFQLSCRCGSAGTLGFLVC